MMKSKSGNIRATEEGFREYLKKRAFMLSMLIASGIAILIWSNTENWNASVIGTHEYDYLRGFFWSFSIAIIIAGTIHLVRTVRCMRNPERFQKAYTDYTDERNQFVLMKSYYYSAYIFIMLTAFAVIVMNFLRVSSVIVNTLAACIGVFALILAITYRIMNKIY